MLNKNIDLSNASVLVTGAAGFMGAHVLAEYLTQETGTAYCIVRKGSFTDARSRLQSGCMITV